MTDLRDFDVYLFDIEGTTTSISFVYDTLFPYARRHVAQFLAHHWLDAGVSDVVDGFRAQAHADAAANLPSTPIPSATAPVDEQRAAVLAAVIEQMDADRKSTPLKALQGLVWRDGYAAGELRGHLFDDVAPAFAAAKARGQRVCIYSSGSIEAQQLLFGYSEAGDLRPLIDGWFDTTTGPKKEASSYRAIAAALGVEPARVLFFSDNLDEVRAAIDAGMGARLTVRPGNPPVVDDTVGRVASFVDLFD